MVRRAERHPRVETRDRKSTRLNSSHLVISYAVFCLKKKNIPNRLRIAEPYERDIVHDLPSTIRVGRRLASDRCERNGPRPIAWVATHIVAPPPRAS